jgi:outer membrane protein assembly factor BamA
VVTDSSFQTAGVWETRITSSYIRKYGTLFSVGHQLLRLGTLSYNFMVENYRTSEQDVTLEKEAFALFKDRIRNVSLCFDMENFNRVPLPEKGLKIHSSLDFAKELFGGTEDYTSFTGSLSSFYTLFGRHTLNLQSHISLADRLLRENQAKYLGGATEMRIMDDLAIYRSFPFMGLNELEKSGDYLAVINMAYRLRISNILYLSIKYDIGNVWYKSRIKYYENMLGSLEKGYGIKMVLDLKALGLAELVYGVLQNRNIGEGVLYFSLGHPL